MSTNEDSVPPTPAARIKRRLLLVDDDAAVLLTLKAVLESHDFEVDTAPSTAEAIEKMTSNMYHMVITDVRMESETAGRDVIRAARRQPYNPATALLTAYPPADEDWHGAETLLVKPIGIHDLLRQIEVLLVQHEDEKQPHSSAFHLLEKQANGLRGERRRKVS